MQGDMQRDLGSKLGKGAGDSEKLGKYYRAGHPDNRPRRYSTPFVCLFNSTALYSGIPARIMTWQRHGNNMRNSCLLGFKGSICIAHISNKGVMKYPSNLLSWC